MKVVYFNYDEYIRSLILQGNENDKWFFQLMEECPQLQNYCRIKKSIKIVSDFACRSNESLNPFPRHFTDIHKIPNYDDKFNESMSSLCDRRAIEIQDKLLKTDKKIYVLWSGGIDSTAVLSSFIKNFSKEGLERIVVSLNHSSILENTLFYLKFIKDNFECINSGWKYTDTSDFFFVDGEPGDFLFGSEFCINNFMSRYPQNVYDNYQDHLDKIDALLEQKYNPGLRFQDWFIPEQISNFKNAKIPVETVMDFFWWINFDNRWSVKTYSKILSYIDYSNITKNTITAVMENGINFFNTDYFQKWSMSKNNISEKKIHKITDYKMVLKKYIFELDCNSYYRDLKTKVNSNTLFPVYNLEKPLIIMDYGNVETNTPTVFNTINILKSKAILEKIIRRV